MQFWKRITNLFAGASHKDSLEFFVSSKMLLNAWDRHKASHGRQFRFDYQP